MAEQNFEQFIERLLHILKDRRKELGLTQGELGERVGKPQSAVARLESGSIKDPHLSMLFLFCEALELSVSDAMANSRSVTKTGKVKTADLGHRLDILRAKMDTLDLEKKSAIANILSNLEILL